MDGGDGDGDGDADGDGDGDCDGDCDGDGDGGGGGDDDGCCNSHLSLLESCQVPIVEPCRLNHNVPASPLTL